MCGGGDRSEVGVFLLREIRIYLASGIDDLGSKVLTLVTDDLAKSILNGRIVRFDKVAVHKLYGQR